MLEHHAPGMEDPARVVVLGASGFIGRAVCRALDDAKLEHIGVTRNEVDLAQPDAAARLREILKADDSIVFLAALTPDRGRGIAPFQANIAIMASVAAVIEDVAPRHVIYFSSDAVYPFIDRPVNEATPAEPTDLYGAMHLSRELMIKGTVAVPVCVFRPTLIYGVEDTHNSYGPNRFRRMALADGKITMFGEGEETRDHILIDDIATLVLLALRHRSRGLLNAVTGVSTSYRDLAHLVAAQCDEEIEIVGWDRSNPITHRQFDPAALVRAFPEFTPTPLEEGLARVHAQAVAQGVA